MGKNYRLAVAFTSYALAGTALALPVVAQDADFSLTSVPLVLEGTALAIDVTTFDADLVGPPAWLPSAGTVADLGTATVDATVGRTTHWWEAWSGVAWAPWWGAYGSVIACGGGHTDGDQNDVLRIDVATQSMSVIKTAATVYYKSDTYCADETTGWLWANATDGNTSLQTGQPFTSHFYAHLLAVPEAALSGQGASNGWLFTPGRRSMPLSGQRQTEQGHLLRMGVDQTWTAHGSGATNAAGHGPACYDSSRNRVWYIAADSNPVSTIYYREMDDGAQGSLSLSGSLSFTFLGGYRTLFYSTADDLLLTVIDNTASLVVIDPDTGSRYSPTVSGTGPTNGSVYWAWAWSDSWGSLCFYDGRGGNTIWFLSPTGDLKTDAWQWSSQTVTGTIRDAYAASPAYTRLVHVASLGNVLLWCPRTNEPVQLIHLSSAP